MLKEREKVKDEPKVGCFVSARINAFVAEEGTSPNYG